MRRQLPLDPGTQGRTVARPVIALVEAEQSAPVDREQAGLPVGFGEAIAVTVEDEPMESLYRGDRADPRQSDNVVSLR